MQVRDEEITKGLVVRLDTTQLRALGGSETNAVITPDGDRAVTGINDFLIVHVDTDAGICTAVPLFPKAAVGNQPLDDEKKAGRADHWIGTETYYSRWQHWRIPVASIVAASGGDKTIDADRRRYADAFPTDLDSIRSGERKNRAAYRSA